MKKNIIAVFGGSFNPPTIAHINLAKQILEKIENVKKIIFVPVSTKYNKSGLALDEFRFKMLEKVCKNEKSLEVSSIELDSDRQLYTIETLKKIKKQNPQNDIYFILGTDNLKEIETWHKAEELLSKFKILVLKRNNDNVQEIIEKSEILKQYKDSIIEFHSIEQIQIRSSLVRENIKKGKNIENLVPKEIYNDVIKNYNIKA